MISVLFETSNFSFQNNILFQQNLSFLSAIMIFHPNLYSPPYLRVPPLGSHTFITYFPILSKNSKLINKEAVNQAHILYKCTYPLCHPEQWLQTSVQALLVRISVLLLLLAPNSLTPQSYQGHSQIQKRSDQTTLPALPHSTLN